MTISRFDPTPASCGRSFDNSMTHFELVFPFPPSLNRAYRAVSGRVLLSKAARQYAIAVRNALPAGRIERLTGRLRVVIGLVPPHKFGKRDWDVANREKVLCDALTKAGFWRDDSQIDSLQLVRCGPRGHWPDGAAVVQVDVIS